MTFSSTQYVLRETFNSLRRNPWLSLASIVTVMVSLVILGFSAFFLANASNMAKTFESQVEIGAFVQKDLTSDQVQALGQQIKDLPGVALVELVTKEQALTEIRNSYGSNSDLLSDLGGTNPLPDKFTVKATEPQKVKELADQVRKLTGVEKVRYGQGVVDKLLQFTNWLRWVGAGVIAAFTMASIVLISINIKMNVFSRRREIQIMKLVGASNWFIRWPFLIEGLILGLVGGLLAALLVGLGYAWLIGYIQGTLTFLPIVRSSVLYWQVLTGVLFLGMGIGATGSAFSLRKFLRV
ncbi:MAG: permease-like cell division protein FtsX [Desulfitobacteriaceae bacterium]